MMAKWFDIVNCGPSCPIRSVSDDRLEWLREFAKKLLNWKAEVHMLGERKRLMALPTLEGLIFTSLNFVNLCEHLLHAGLQYICLRRTFWKLFLATSANWGDGLKIPTFTRRVMAFIISHNGRSSKN